MRTTKEMEMGEFLYGTSECDCAFLVPLAVEYLRDAWSCLCAEVSTAQLSDEVETFSPVLP